MRPVGGKCDRGLKWAIVGLALVCRLAVFVTAAQHAGPRFTRADSESYMRAGEAIRARASLVTESGRPAWSREPGYPLVLALMFASGLASPLHVEAIVLLQIALGTLTVALAGLVASQFEGRSAGIAAAALMAVEPSSLSFSNLILSECLYSLVVVTLVLTWNRWLAEGGLREIVLLATCTGILPLIRPMALYLPLVVGPFVVLTSPPRRRARCIAIYLAVALLFPAAWALRNLRLLGSAELSTTGPMAKALFARSVEDLAGVPRPGSAAAQPWDHEFAQESALSMPEVMEIQNRYFRDTLAAYPFTALRRLAQTGVLMAGVPDGELPELLLADAPIFAGGSVRERLVWLARLGPLGAWLLLGVATSLAGLAAIPFLAARAASMGPRQRNVLLLLVTLVLYHLALGSFVAHQGARYRAPIMPLLSTLFAAGSVMALQRLRGSPGPTAPGTVPR